MKKIILSAAAILLAATALNAGIGVEAAKKFQSGIEKFDKEKFESEKLRAMQLSNVKVNEWEMIWECQKNATFPAQLKNCTKFVK